MTPRRILFALTIFLFISKELHSAGYIPSRISDTWTSFVPDSKDKAFLYGVSAIMEHERWLWIGTEGHGLWKYRDGVFENLSEHLHASHVRIIAKGGDGSLWFCYDKWGGGAAKPGDESGLANYRNGEWRQYDMPDLIPGFGIILNKSFKTKDDVFLFSSIRRLIRFKAGKWELIKGVEIPWYFFEAKDGTIWVTGEDGERIWRSIGDGFQPVTGNNGVSFNWPLRLIQARDGTIWIGDSGLVWYKDGKFGRIEAKPTFDDNRISPRFTSSDGTLFVEKSQGALYPYHDGKWTISENTNWVFGGSIIETKEGSIWYSVGGTEQGLVNYNHGVWHRYTNEITPSAIPDVESLHEGSDGSIWVGIKEGYMAHHSMGEWRTIPRKLPITFASKRESISTWYNASDGSMWVGMKDGELRHFVPSRGTLNLKTGGSGDSLFLMVDRGRKDTTQWSVKYGYSGSEKTPPAEYFIATFNTKGEVPITVPSSGEKTYLHAYAVDEDGTVVMLSDGTRENAIVVAEGLDKIPDLPIPIGAITHINGEPVPGDAVEFRGEVEKFTEPFYQPLADGFHQLQLNVQNVKMRVAIYKEKQMIKAFHPFSRSLAIIIAVSDYPASSGYVALPKAEAQALQLADYLKSQSFETTTLLGPMATKSNAINALSLTNVGPNDRVLVYFGGHGGMRKSKQDDVGYIVPFDGRKAKLEETGIALPDLIGKNTRSLNARQVMYVLDSCHSGFAIKRGERDDKALKQFKAYQDIKYYAQKGQMILTAGSNEEEAIDVNGGIFTHAFLEGIRGRADREVGDTNGVVDFYELFQYVHREVSMRAANLTYGQHPDFSASGGVGRFFFVTDRSLLK